MLTGGGMIHSPLEEIFIAEKWNLHVHFQEIYPHLVYLIEDCCTTQLK